MLQQIESISKWLEPDKHIFNVNINEKISFPLENSIQHIEKQYPHTP